MRAARVMALALTATVPAGCGSAASPGAAERAPATSHVVAARTVAPAGRALPLATLPGLGAFSARCRHGAATVVFRAARHGATEAVSAGGRTSLLDPARRVRGPGRLHGVQVWQISRISEGRIAVADATLSSARMRGGPVCFVTATATISRRPR